MNGEQSEARLLFELSPDCGHADDKSAIFGFKCKSQQFRERA
jgi:hypothetical protein